MAARHETTPSGGELFTRAKSRTQSFFAPRRSWGELIAHPSSYSRPHSSSDLTSRLNRNLNYFRVNYAIVILLTLFLSLLWHPVSMIVFLVIFLFWFYFFFHRDEPVILFNRLIDDRLVLGLLSVVTIVGLILTSVWVNVVVAVLIGVGVVLLHAAIRVTEDFYEEIDDDDGIGAGAGGGLRSFVGSGSNAPTSF